MQDFTFWNPTKIIFGKDTIAQIGTETKNFGKKAFLVYGQASIKHARISTKVVDALKDVGLVKTIMESTDKGWNSPMIIRDAPP